MDFNNYDLFMRANVANLEREVRRLHLEEEARRSVHNGAGAGRHGFSPLIVRTRVVAWMARRRPLGRTPQPQ